MRSKLSPGLKKGIGIGQCLQSFRETGGHARRPGQGQPQSTNQVDKRFIRLQALINRFLTRNEINNQILNAQNGKKGLMNPN